MGTVIFFESYKSQIELEKLSLELIDILWDRISKSGANAEISLSEVNIDRYDELKDFIKKFNNLTIATTSSEKMHVKGVDALFINKEIEGIKYQYIYMYISDKRLKTFIDEKKEELFKDMYMKYLIHEIKHAYDDYRSNGKFENVKIDKKSVQDTLNKYKIYYNLPYEVSAYITSYIYETPLYEWDIDESWKNGRDEYKIKPFNEVFKAFISKLSSFGKNLDEKNRNKVIKQFAKFYMMEKENKLILSYIKKRHSYLK